MEEVAHVNMNAIVKTQKRTSWHSTSNSKMNDEKWKPKFPQKKNGTEIQQGFLWSLKEQQKTELGGKLQFSWEPKG